MQHRRRQRQQPCQPNSTAAAAELPNKLSTKQVLSAKLAGEVRRSRRFSRRWTPQRWQCDRCQCAVAALSALAVAAIVALSGVLTVLDTDPVHPDHPEALLRLDGQTRLNVSDKVAACKMGHIGAGTTQDDETCRKWRRAFHWVEISPFEQEQFAREQLRRQRADAAADAGSLADLPGPGGNGLNDVDSLLQGLASITVSRKNYCDMYCTTSGLSGRVGRCSMCRHSGARSLWQQLEPEHVQMAACCCCLLAVCWCLHAMAGRTGKYTAKTPLTAPTPSEAIKPEKRLTPQKRLTPPSPPPSAAVVARVTAALECPICFEPYGSAPQFTPRQMACGHTFCECCLDQMLVRLPAEKGGKVLECATCREPMELRRGNAKGLEKNLTILQMME